MLSDDQSTFGKQVEIGMTWDSMQLSGRMFATMHKALNSICSVTKESREREGEEKKGWEEGGRGGIDTCS